jgi:branched-chain amino acid transport system substrate-binding protein
MTRRFWNTCWTGALVIAGGIAVAASTAVSHAADNPIKIGWLGSLSGVLAPYGLENKRGVEFAVERINKAGGIKGRPLEVIYVDSKFDSAFAVQSIQRFALQDGVVAILGDISSALTVAEVPATARFGIPQLASLAATPKITTMGSKFIFRPYPSVLLTYGAIGAYATDKLKMKRFATIAYNDEGGLSSIQAFNEAVGKASGAQVVASEVVPVDTKEFKGILTKLRASNPEALVVAAAAPVSGLIVRQARELGWDVALLGHGGYQAVQEFRDVAGPAGDGMVLATTYAPGYYTHAEAKQFVADWQAANGGKAPRDLEAHGFDQVGMLAWAINQSSPERTAIRDQLAKLKDWPGAAGLYTFLENGDVKKDVVIQSWKGGQLTPIEVFGVK